MGVDSKMITANQARDIADSADYPIGKVLNGINSGIKIQAENGLRSLTTMYRAEAVSDEVAAQVISDLGARGFSTQHKMKDGIHTFIVKWM